MTTTGFTKVLMYKDQIEYTLDLYRNRILELDMTDYRTSSEEREYQQLSEWKDDLDVKYSELMDQIEEVENAQ